MVLQLQIHYERRDYLRSQKLVNDLVDGVALPGSPTVKRFSDCSYTSNGAVFATRYLGCETGVSIVYSNTTEEDTKKVRDLLRQEMKSEGIKSHENPGGMGKYTVSIDVFDVNNIGCFMSSTYYGENVQAYERDESAPKQGNASLTMIDCGGSAKAEYFPVTKN